MERIGALCREQTDLTAADIALVEQKAQSLQLISDLIGGDVFIDCMNREGVAIVVAQSRPRFQSSQYCGEVVGMPALRENESGVYHAFSRKSPIHDTKAVTQEHIAVLQDVVPIENAAGSVVAVLISERDVSREVSLAEKLTAAEQERSDLFRHMIAAPAENVAAADAAVYAREAHHRIKNNLQMIASVCNVRMRQSKSDETRQRLLETGNMILTVASLHDILSLEENSDPETDVALDQLLSKVREALGNIFSEDGGIQLVYACEPIITKAERAMSVALVLTELVTNAVNHAFPDGTGTIRVLVHAGNRFASAEVCDDGTGFSASVGNSTGLRIANALIQDKLGGKLDILSDAHGTRAAFTFLP